MSKWDEKAYEHAEGRSGEYFGALPEQLFEWGARWQREQLLTDDVIERAAGAFYEAGNAHTWQGSMRLSWDRMVWGDPRTAKNYRVHMRAALMAAIEGGE